MKTIFTLALLILTLPSFAQQVHRVNNNEGAAAGKFNYTDVSAAIAAASDGDYIYIEPSPTSYGSFDVNKRLNIVGNGMFPELVQDGPFNKLLSSVNLIHFVEGSDSSSVEGICTNYLYCTDTKAVTIRKNRIYYGISLNRQTSDILIYQNYIHDNIAGGGYPGYAEKTTIKNNMIGSSVTGMRSSDIRNNTFTSNTFRSNYQCVIVNNIFDIRDGSGIYDIAANNISTVATNNFYILAPDTDLTTIPDDGSKRVITNKPDDVFMVSNPWTAQPFNDDNIKLKADSPALKVGTDGKEAGAFGGLTPYVPHAMPHIPIITSVWSTGAGTTSLPLTVKISARSN